MKLFLFGGAEIDNPSRSVGLLKNLLKKTFLEINVKSILHIPFARPHSFPEDKGEWDDGWLNELLKDTGIQILDARKQEDINNSNNSAIFINGGPERRLLAESIKNNKGLLDKVFNSGYIVAESAGSMVMADYMRISRTDDNVMKALGILKNVVIEPHYTERNYKQYLPGDMEKSGVRYGIGIDSATGIVCESTEFPNKWEKIGAGNIYIKTA